MTPAEKFIANLSSALNNPVVHKTAEEEEEERMKRIFDLVPRRKRTDYSNTPPKSPEVVAGALPKPINTQEWLLQVIRNMNAVDDHPMHIIDKTLDLNDIDQDQDCLSMPLETLIQKDFLTPDETTIVDFMNDGIMGVAAFLVDQRAQLWSVFLRKRFLKSDSDERLYLSYLLRGGWSDAVKANGMRNGDNISVWSFRYNGVLYFALAPTTTD